MSLQLLLRLAPRPAEQSEAGDDARASDDGPERAAGHRRSLDQVEPLAEPDRAGHDEQRSDHALDDGHGIAILPLTIAFVVDERRVEVAAQAPAPTVELLSWLGRADANVRRGDRCVAQPLSAADHLGGRTHRRVDPRRTRPRRELDRAAHRTAGAPCSCTPSAARVGLRAAPRAAAPPPSSSTTTAAPFSSTRPSTRLDDVAVGAREPAVDLREQGERAGPPAPSARRTSSSTVRPSAAASGSTDSMQRRYGLETTREMPRPARTPGSAIAWSYPASSSGRRRSSPSQALAVARRRVPEEDHAHSIASSSATSRSYESSAAASAGASQRSSSISSARSEAVVVERLHQPPAHALRPAERVEVVGRLELARRARSAGPSPPRPRAARSPRTLSPSLGLPLRERPVVVLRPVDEEHLAVADDEPASGADDRLRRGHQRAACSSLRQAARQAARASRGAPARGRRAGRRRAPDPAEPRPRASRRRSSATTASWCSPSTSWSTFARRTTSVCPASSAA